jgi:hypothetical protein
VQLDGHVAAQAQVEVLVEKVGARIERAEPPQGGGAGDERGGDRPPDAPWSRAAPVLRRERRGQQRPRDLRGAARAGVRAVLHAAVGVEQAGDEQGVAPAHRGDQAHEAGVEELHVRVRATR